MDYIFFYKKNMDYKMNVIYKIIALAIVNILLILYYVNNFYIKIAAVFFNALMVYGYFDILYKNNVFDYNLMTPKSAVNF